MKLSALIVDDEPLARERLRQLLGRETDVDIAGECADGRAAVAAIRSQKPDLVFLDVQMPELDGFGVLQELESADMPVVIFVTAYDQFALKAFEVHAVDYLLKPFDSERFRTALQRARDRIRHQTAGHFNQHLSALLADVRPAPTKPDRLAIKSSGKVLLIKLDDIDWVESSDNYVKLHVGSETHLHRETMSAMEGLLPGQKFVRISRSTIVNLDKIKELQPMFHGEYSVILRNGTRLTLSRNFRERLDQLLGKDS